MKLLLRNFLQKKHQQRSKDIVIQVGRTGGAVTQFEPANG